MSKGELTTEDSSLLERGRSGDAHAYEVLYKRYFSPVRRAAGRYVRDRHEADDVTQEAFYLVFRAIKAGHGPDDSFLGYILATVRRLAAKQSTQRANVVVTDDLAAYETGPKGSGASGKPLDDVLAACASLPERWRRILWLIEVEQYSPAELAPTLRMSSSAVSSLATRARDGLRTAFLAQQVLDDAGGCTEFAPRLAAYARGTLAKRWLPQLAGHAESCSTCRERLAALADQLGTGLTTTVEPATR